jgi:hypothetical protein
MRLAYALASLAVTGCASLLGVDDPGTEHEVSPTIAGTFLLVIDVRTDGAFVDTLQLEADVEVVDAEARLLAMELVPLDHDTRDPLDQSFGFDAIEVENLPGLDFEISAFDLDLPADAIASAVPITLDAILEGSFPILDEEDGPIDDGFCGSVSGQITSNKEVLDGTTFAAVRLETGADLPDQLETSCETLVDPENP